MREADLTRFPLFPQCTKPVQPPKIHSMRAPGYSFAKGFRLRHKGNLGSVTLAGGDEVSLEKSTNRSCAARKRADKSLMTGESYPVVLVVPLSAMDPKSCLT